jgi:3-oxoacyl-[acyl-carrier-protein] synthase-3
MALARKKKYLRADIIPDEEIEIDNPGNYIRSALCATKASSFIIANGCAGFNKALSLANHYVKQGKYALVIGVETLSKIVDYGDGDPIKEGKIGNGGDIVSTLFGDGAGAAVLGPTDQDKGILRTHAYSDPFDGNLNLIYQDKNGILRMPYGNRVFAKATRSMFDSVAELLDNEKYNDGHKISVKDIGLIIPHQANLRIIDWIGQKIYGDYKNNGNNAKVFVNIEKYGNMSAATCAIGLYEAWYSDRIKKGDYIALTAFGTGLVTDSILMRF